MNNQPQTNNDGADTHETRAHYVQRLAADINTFNQVAYFCGMATVNEQVPSVRLILGNKQQTNLYISAAELLPALSLIGKRLQESLIAREIDVDELLEDISKGILLTTKQNGG